MTISLHQPLPTNFNQVQIIFTLLHLIVSTLKSTLNCITREKKVQIFSFLFTSPAHSDRAHNGSVK